MLITVPHLVIVLRSDGSFVSTQNSCEGMQGCEWNVEHFGSQHQSNQYTGDLYLCDSEAAIIS